MDETPMANIDSSTENTWQSMVVVKSPSPESTVIPDPPSPECMVVPDPSSPENPVVVEAQTMSTSVWESVEPSIIKGIQRNIFIQILNFFLIDFKNSKHLMVILC
jgi:hypothetical protein